MDKKLTLREEVAEFAFVMFIMSGIIMTFVGLMVLLLSVSERRSCDMQEKQCHGQECLESNKQGRN